MSTTAPIKFVVRYEYSTRYRHTETIEFFERPSEAQFLFRILNARSMDDMLKLRAVDVIQDPDDEVQLKFSWIDERRGNYQFKP